MGNGTAKPERHDDGAAVEDLSRRYHTVLVRYFTRRGVIPEDAADCAQEVFARLSRQGALEGVTNPEGYLFVAAGNIAMDHFRRCKVRRDYLADKRYEASQTNDEFSPERLAAGRQELDAVVAALNELPERMRNVFILARLENLPRAEIAERLGVSKRLVEQEITLATAWLSERRERMT